MDNLITEYNNKNYPIEPIWVLKKVFVSLIILPLILIILSIFIWWRMEYSSDNLTRYSNNLYYPVVYFIFIPFHFFYNLIQRWRYHYNFDETFLTVNQGLIRLEKRQIPYGVIQNVLITRGILDRIFGLSTLTIQNATQAPMPDTKYQQAHEAGFYGNTVNIPGLSKVNAETLRDVLLHRIKSSPTVELGM